MPVQIDHLLIFLSGVILSGFISAVTLHVQLKSIHKKIIAIQFTLEKKS